MPRVTFALAAVGNDRSGGHPRCVHSIEEVRCVLELISSGLSDCAIERQTQIPRRTILDWRKGRIPRFAKSGADRSCPSCGHAEHEPQGLPVGEYGYLLGLYLGDGSIATYPRAYRLKIYMDRSYQGIVEECLGAMRRVMPLSRPGVFQRPNDRTDEIYSYSKAWPCLLPQHGPGKKHLRKIRLASWQWQLVEQDPRGLLRGLIHSDGSRHINTVRHPQKTYRYSKYEFTNLSEDIRGIFCVACDLLGIEWRMMNHKTISIARRRAVAAMDRFIGPKR